MIIDFHAHILPEAVLDVIRRGKFAPHVTVQPGRRGGEAVVANLTILGKPAVMRNRLPEELVDIDLRLSHMKNMGVDKQILSAITNMTFYGLDAGLNREISALYNDAITSVAERTPGKFHCMCNVPLQDPAAAAAELDRSVKRGHIGVKIGTNVAGENLSNPALDVFWAKAESLDVPVFIHPGDILGAEDRMKEFYLHNLIANPLDTTIAAACLIFGGVLDRFPGLKVILAHLGGFTPWIRGRWQHGYEVREETRVRGAKAPDNYMSKLYYDTVIHNADCLEFAVKTLGVDTILYGTDYPWDVGLLGPATEIHGLSRLSKADQAKVLAGNTRRLYKI
ncbi:MAG: amidohydrolase family protein [Nitrospinota bacterium]